MLRRRLEMGSDATVVQKPSAIMSSDATKTMPEMGTVRESVKTAATVSPTEGEVATIAYQLWLDRGRPIGSDQEDWFRAEVMLKNPVVVTREDPFRSPSVPCLDTRTESGILAEFPWEGHWEVWEREWVSARWVWDVRDSHVGVSSRAGSSGKAA